MKFEYLGWQSVAARTVTYDIARLMDGATKVKCSAFADEVIRHMG